MKKGPGWNKRTRGKHFRSSERGVVAVLRKNVFNQPLSQGFLLLLKEDRLYWSTLFEAVNERETHVARRKFLVLEPKCVTVEWSFRDVRQSRNYENSVRKWKLSLNNYDGLRWTRNVLSWWITSGNCLNYAIVFLSLIKKQTIFFSLTYIHIKQFFIQTIILTVTGRYIDSTFTNYLSKRRNVVKNRGFYF